MFIVRSTPASLDRRPKSTVREALATGNWEAPVRRWLAHFRSTRCGFRTMSPP